MAISLAVVLCITVIVCAIAAERAARAQHRLRAVCLNLFGIFCLGAGLVSIYAWCHGGTIVMRQVAMAQTVSHPGTLVRLLVDVDTSVTLDDSADSADPASVLPEQEPAPSPHVDEPLTELPAEAADPAVLENQIPEAESPDLATDRVQIDYAARPAWVECETHEEGPVHQVSVTAGPYRLVRQTHKALDEELKKATDEYINELVGSSTAAHWIAYDVARIRRTLVAPTNFFDEKVISPTVGVMHQSHALLEFGPEFQRDVDRAWHQIVARARLVKLALAAAAVLGTLMLLFSYFQADTATRGFYTGRLKFATVVAILGLIAAGFLLARSIPWLWP